MKRKCVFAGSFDPPTLGHKALIEQCLQLFDEVLVAIMLNPHKQPYFTLEQKKQMLKLTVDSDRIRIVEFDGTVAELLQKEDTPFYVRGLRNSTDFDYENANFYASKKLNQDITAVYLPCPQELLHVSSSMVRSSLQFNTPINEYVTKAVEAYIRQMQTKR